MRGRQARNFSTNVPKTLDLKSSSEQIFSENWRWVPLLNGIRRDLLTVVWLELRRDERLNMVANGSLRFFVFILAFTGVYLRLNAQLNST